MVSYLPHLLRPYWLLALIPLALLLFFLRSYRQKADAWKSVCDPHLLPYLLVHFDGHKRLNYSVVLAAAWLLAVLALAGPSWSSQSRLVYKNNAARVIVLDLSAAMSSTDLAPNRMTRARYKLLDILQRSRQGQTALIAFAEEPYVVTPLTHDTNTIAALVGELDPDIMPVRGFHIDRALALAAQLLEQGGAPSGDILLMTGGKPSANDIAVAHDLSERGYRISVLGVGTLAGGPIVGSDGEYVKDKNGAIVLSQLDSHGLARLASIGKGMYFPFSADSNDVQTFLSFTADQQAVENTAVNSSALNEWLDQGYWLVILLLPFAWWGLWKLEDA